MSVTVPGNVDYVLWSLTETKIHSFHWVMLDPFFFPIKKDKYSTYISISYGERLW